MFCSTCGHRECRLGHERCAGTASPNIPGIEFRLAANGFGLLSGALRKFAAVQRGWRDFRIAQSSFERANPRCQKIGRSGPGAVAQTRTMEPVMNEHAVIDKWSGLTHP